MNRNRNFSIWQLVVLTVLLLCNQTSFGQLPARYTGLAPNSPFGMDIREGIAANGAIAQDLGIKWVRGLGVEYFKKLERRCLTKPGTTLNAYKGYGVSSLQVCFYAQGPYKNGTNLGPPVNMTTYINKIYDFVAATHDLMPYYEQWNEPWVDEWAWQYGTGDEYRQMLKDIWNRVKADYPNVEIIGGGSVAYNRDLMYAKGEDIGYADGSVNHAYSVPSPNAFGFTTMQLELDKKYSLSGG
ncbi:MAG: hypothetical protein HC896_14040 [Bacteroidales bacterium]|nr:hypothetical protein [Bacteroidales bacterium]